MIFSRFPRMFALVAFILAAIAAGAGEAARADVEVTPRARVIVDNDFGGDPDGLFALAQQLLSPSVEVRGIIGSHHYPGDFFGSPGSSEHAVEVAGELLAVMGLAGKVPVVRGTEERIGNPALPLRSAAARLIVEEAMRDDVKTPLFVTCGAGLSDVASACLIEPRIAARIRLIWIGGPEHEGLASPPPGAMRVEYNLGIDLHAAQVVFNVSGVPIWQVPRDAYRQALISQAELTQRLGSGGKLGAFLLGRLRELRVKAGGALGETYVLGDSPLVLLTALQSPWEADPSSSRYATRPTPRISTTGEYESNPADRPMRVYTSLDIRLMFEDLFAKVARFDAAQQRSQPE